MSGNQYQRSLNAQRTSDKIAAFLLGLLCGSVPLLFFALAFLSRTEENQAGAYIVGIVFQLLAAFVMLPLALLKRTRFVAYGLFIPVLIADCLEILGHSSFQPITPCSAVLLVFTAIVLFVIWLRK